MKAWPLLAVMVVNGLCLYLLEALAGHESAKPAERRRHAGPNLLLTAMLLGLNGALDRLLAAGPGPGAADAGLLARAGLPGWARMLAVVVALDGLAYAAHVLLHALPPAWRFHRVHHCDPHVDVTTAFRQHPFETLWRYSFVLGGALALGASSRSLAVYLTLSALNAQLEHADFSLPPRLDRALRLVFTTPAMHRVHHSRLQPETDTNYSNIFSAWDRLFGTYRAPRTGERIDCGLDGFDVPARQRTSALLALPFS